MAGILGGDNGAKKLQQRQLEAQQRRSLADMARQQGEIDQAASTPTGRRQGRGLLTFLSGTGQDTFG